MPPGWVSCIIWTWNNGFRCSGNIFNRDLDVVIRLPGVDDQNDKKRALFQLASTLTKSGVTKEAQVKHFARVPVVTFQTVPNLGARSPSTDTRPYLLNER